MIHIIETLGGILALYIIFLIVHHVFFTPTHDYVRDYEVKKHEEELRSRAPLEKVAAGEAAHRKARQFLNGDSDAGILSCANGVGQVAGLLAQRFGIDVPAALELRGVPYEALSRISDDMQGVINSAKERVRSPSQVANRLFEEHAFGAVLFYNLSVQLYLSGPAFDPFVRGEARKIAREVSDLIRVLAEIAVEARPPSDARSN